MEGFLHKGIKEVINEYPAVEEILNEFDIGCGPCSVGTCLLKDIVEVHGLSPEAEREMMARVAKTIDPNSRLEFPQIKRTEKVRHKAFQYSPPMKRLVDEHVLIKRWAALIPKVVESLDLDSEGGRQLILDGIDFIRSYADQYHHAKEEEILFKYFDEDLDILKVMHEDHEQARGHVRAALEAIEHGDRSAVAENLSAYRDILTEHIRKEDEILYPWMDRNLTMTQVGELFGRFNEADDRTAATPEKYQAFIEQLEERFKDREVLE